MEAPSVVLTVGDGSVESNVFVSNKQSKVEDSCKDRRSVLQLRLGRKGYMNSKHSMLKNWRTRLEEIEDNVVKT